MGWPVRRISKRSTKEMAYCITVDSLLQTALWDAIRVGREAQALWGSHFPGHRAHPTSKRDATTKTCNPQVILTVAWAASVVETSVLPPKTRRLLRPTILSPPTRSRSATTTGAMLQVSSLPRCLTGASLCWPNSRSPLTAPMCPTFSRSWPTPNADWASVHLLVLWTLRVSSTSPQAGTHAKG